MEERSALGVDWCEFKSHTHHLISYDQSKLVGLSDHVPFYIAGVTYYVQVRGGG